MKLKFFFILALLVFSSQAWPQEELAPRIMKTAGFWISRHPSPDTVIMTPDQIEQFNIRLRNATNLSTNEATGNIKLTKDIFTLVQDLKTQNLLQDLEKTIDDITAKEIGRAHV